MSDLMIVQQASKSVSERNMSIDKFIELAEGAGMIPKTFYKNGKLYKSELIISLMYGATLGITPIESLNSIYVLNGRTVLYGDALKRVIIEHPECCFFKEWYEGEGMETRAICHIKRVKANGAEIESVQEFSMLDAKEAGKLGSGMGWKYPRRMIMMRARGFCVRDTFPDILRGGITKEEADDYDHTVSFENNSSTLVNFKALVDSTDNRIKKGIEELTSELKSMIINESWEEADSFIKSEIVSKQLAYLRKQNREDCQELFQLCDNVEAVMKTR